MAKENGLVRISNLTKTSDRIFWTTSIGTPRNITKYIFLVPSVATLATPLSTWEKAWAEYLILHKNYIKENGRERRKEIEKNMRKGRDKKGCIGGRK